MDPLEELPRYCAEAQAQGRTARPEMVEKLLTLPSDQWGAQFSDTEMAIASCLLMESHRDAIADIDCPIEMS